MTPLQGVAPTGMEEMTELDFMSLLRGEMAGVLELMRLGPKSVSASDLLFLLEKVDAGLKLMR